MVRSSPFHLGVTFQPFNVVLICIPGYAVFAAASLTTVLNYVVKQERRKKMHLSHWHRFRTSKVKFKQICVLEFQLMSLSADIENPYKADEGSSRIHALCSSNSSSSSSSSSLLASCGGSSSQRKKKLMLVTMLIILSGAASILFAAVFFHGKLQPAIRATQFRVTANALLAV